MFFDNFQRLCDLNNTSPSKVVTEIGMNKSAVTYWKNSGATPKGEVLQKLADYFDVTTDFLLYGKTDRLVDKIADAEIRRYEQMKKSPDSEPSEKDKITFDDFTYAMYDHAKDLTEDEKKMLLEMAEFMKKKRGL